MEELAGLSMRAEEAVVVATMSRYDEAALEAAIKTEAGYIGLVASRARGAQVLGALRSKAIPDTLLERVKAPAGLDLGPSRQGEIAVAVLAEVVAHQHRVRGVPSEPLCAPGQAVAYATDPVCGMTVAVVPSALSAQHRGKTYYFCSAHCRQSFRGESDRGTGRRC